MDDLLGNPLPEQLPPAPIDFLKSQDRRASLRRTEFDKKADRTAAYWEHTAPPADPLETRWRHGYWAGKRERVSQILQMTGASSQAHHNFLHCGSTCLCQWSPSLQRRRLTAYYCHSRHCEPCGRSKANKIAGNLRSKLKLAAAKEYRLMTFTLKHSDAPLSDQIKRLYACFKKLRGTRLWKSTQKGGAAILEVKWSNSGWHPHLHAVVSGAWLNQNTLSDLWHKVTGDSFIIDVRMVTRAEDAAHYVCKYITKSTSDSVWVEDDRAQEYVLAMKSVRTCLTFGSWRKFPLLKVEHRTTDWEPEGTLKQLVQRAAAGEIAARAILNDLRRRGGGLDEHQCREYLPAPSTPFNADDLPSPHTE